MATIKDALDIIGKLTTTDESLTTMLLPDAIIFSSVIVPVSPSAAKSVQITTERLCIRIYINGVVNCYRVLLLYNRNPDFILQMRKHWNSQSLYSSESLQCHS